MPGNFCARSSTPRILYLRRTPPTSSAAVLCLRPARVRWGEGATDLALQLGTEVVQSVLRWHEPVLAQGLYHELQHGRRSAREGGIFRSDGGGGHAWARSTYDHAARCVGSRENGRAAARCQWPFAMRRLTSPGVAYPSASSRLRKARGSSYLARGDAGSLKVPSRRATKSTRFTYARTHRTGVFSPSPASTTSSPRPHLPGADGGRLPVSA